MTLEERHLVNELGRCMVMFTRLPVLHPSDVPEVVPHIHALQNIVLARSGYREIKKEKEEWMT